MGTKRKGAPRRAAAVPASCPSGKRSYVDRAHARRAGRLAQRVHGEPFDVYRCTIIFSRDGNRPGCGQYHLTTRRKA